MEHDEILFSSALLVEDEAAHTLLIERGLRGLVSSVVKVSSIGQAREKLVGGSFDLIISDLNLPDARGDEAVLAIRAVAKKTPLLVLTSSAALGDAVAAMRAGASDFLVKNFDTSFRDIVRLALSRLRGVLRAEQERAQATRDRDLLQEAIENSNDGLAVIDRDGTVRHCNSGFASFLDGLGVTSRNVFDIPFDSVERGDELLHKLRERVGNLEPGGVWTTEFTRLDDDEAAFDISLSAAHDDSTEKSIVLWVRDSRERKRRERLQREILSATTHDLKGPLGAISVSCEVLLDKPNPDERAHALLERISTSASAAINLIEEFLSMRRIEEGAFVMHPIRAEVDTIVSRVVESFALTAKTRAIDLALSSTEKELIGCVDPLGFERVLSNLVTNGIKFTPKGGSVVVNLCRGVGGVVLSVRDTGSGMEPSEAQRVFTRYARLTNHSRVAGSGLGLFIVKCIVNAHGGTIDVCSAPGKGTTFDVFFPDLPPCNERGEVLCLDFA
jgi:two-component system phosphate regulon sensor histidine kinase PhoR